MKNFSSQKLEFISFERACKEFGKEAVTNKLLDIWESSVLASDDEIKSENPNKENEKQDEDEESYIKEADSIIIASYSRQWLGFIATKGNEILLLFVNPAYFRQGIGTMLLKKAFESHLKNYKSVTLSSRSHALDFYKKFGFVPTKKKLFYNGGSSIPLESLRLI